MSSDATATSGESVRIALLVPLGGQHAPLGSGMLKAAQMAVFDLADPRMELWIYNTQGTPQGAEAAAERAIANGARLIVGPLLAASTRAVAPRAQAAGVPVLSFSSDRSVAGNGVFILGFTPAAEVERIVAFAAEQGARRFAVIAPSDAYGSVVVEALKSAATAHGGEVTSVVLHDPRDADWSGAVRQLGTPAAPAAAGAATGGTQAAAPTPAAGAPGFDALLIAVGGKPLRSVTSNLAANGIDPARVRILGTGAWDESGAGGDAGVAGGIYAGPPPTARSGFVGRYRSVYGADPPRLAGLAYDATALAAVLVRERGSQGFSSAALTSPAGFRGSEGVFRLSDDGVARRGLVVMQASGGAPLVVGEAPTSLD